MRVSNEHFFHAREDVRGYVENALAIVDELELRGEDRSALLPKVVELLAQKQVMFEQMGPITMQIPGEKLR